jgi:lipopolysaccharide/colanic/teichoic acid biosynthesis glycosyltransferase
MNAVPCPNECDHKWCKKASAIRFEGPARQAKKEPSTPPPAFQRAPQFTFGPFPPRRVRLFRRVYEVLKRLLDLCTCVVLLIPFGAVMAVCALLICISDGRPILFVQHRTGRGGRRFRLYKFRTMVKNAEELKQKYWHLNKMSGPEFKLTDDPRVTPMGCFLRKWSLDEFPQIFNVLKGDMSLVGPRPTSFDASKYALWQTTRLEVQPGLTGLAQVSGRSSLSFEEKLRLDIKYVEERDIWLDLQILARTPVVLLNGKGAH